MTAVLQGREESLALDPLDLTRVTGERIYPSGKRRLHEALVNHGWASTTGRGGR